MKGRMRHVGLSMGVALLLAACEPPAPLATPSISATTRRVAQQEARPEVPVERFGRVQDPRYPRRRIYRGGEPSETALQRLAALGVEVIVSLQDPSDPDEQEAVARERALTARLGLTFVNLQVPMTGTPSDATIERFLQLARASEDDPLYLHCLWGRDRTGGLIAAYRIRENGYNADQALAEMESYGFVGPYFPDMEAFVRRYDERY